MTLDRPALLGVLYGYLAALAQRDVPRLALARDVRFTENCIPLSIGTALQATATGLCDYRLPFIDVEAQQAGCFTVVEEMGTPVVLCVRLCLRDDDIAEIEHLVARQGTFLYAPKALVVPDPIWDAVEPQPARRADLAAIANAYYDSIEQSNGDIVPVTNYCLRVENGVLTALNPDWPRDGGVGYMTVRDGNSSGYFSFMEAVRSRRFPVIDEERGLVLAMTAFDAPGTVESVEVRGVGRLPISRSPSTTIVAELFKVREGAIHRIEAVLDSLPYGIRSGWEA